MLYCKVICFALLVAVASCEPPVQGYNYQPPRNNVHNSYNTPTNSYLPPTTGVRPSNNYLPPASYSPSYSNSGPSYSHTGPSYANSGSNYHSTGSGYPGAGSGHSGGHHDHHGHGNDNEVPKSYEFGYSVKDAQSGNDYDRREMSDGNVVRGEYRVQLPDGRTQIVTYHADWQTGFHADVRYEGEAQYPEPINNNHQGGYNYNAPSDFKGSLNGFQGNSYKPSTAYGPPGYH